MDGSMLNALIRFLNAFCESRAAWSARRCDSLTGSPGALGLGPVPGAGGCTPNFGGGGFAPSCGGGRLPPSCGGGLLPPHGCACGGALTMAPGGGALIGVPGAGFLHLGLEA